MWRQLHRAFDFATAPLIDAPLRNVIRGVVVLSVGCVLGLYYCYVQMDDWFWQIDPNFPTLGHAPSPAEFRHAVRMMNLWGAAAACDCLIFIVGAIYIAAIVRRRMIRSYRESCGLCVSCGYDLRGTPDRCPECGAVPKPAKGAA